MKKLNLDLIRGLVRPIISILLVLTVVYLAIRGKVEAGEIVTIVGMVIAFHFGERAATKKVPSTDAETPSLPIE